MKCRYCGMNLLLDAEMCRETCAYCMVEDRIKSSEISNAMKKMIEQATDYSRFWERSDDAKDEKEDGK